MSMPFLLESESVSSSELFISSVSDALVKSDKTEYGFLSSRGLATSNGTHLKTKIQDLSLSEVTTSKRSLVVNLLVTERT